MLLELSNVINISAIVSDTNIKTNHIVLGFKVTTNNINLNFLDFGLNTLIQNQGG
jgi:hypothetical protein